MNINDINGFKDKMSFSKAWLSGQQPNIAQSKEFIESVIFAILEGVTKEEFLENHSKIFLYAYAESHIETYFDIMYQMRIFCHMQWEILTRAVEMTRDRCY
jgi:hypothetical protein